ncbi:MAG: hydroxymethylbilane synthase [Thermodesulfobacteriota bacterium]|nr:hydroxymethylbilane synthase [Thermodesulfobacteriota bacterium]
MADDVTPIRIGTRGSKLALWQAEWVKARLEENCPQCRAELAVIKTRGDKILDTPLAKIGGKGLFVKEIEEALLDGRVDLAVHSMKDMPGEIPQGLCIGAVPVRETPYDALISRNHIRFDDLPEGACIGTSSLRRSSQLRHIRPDIAIAPLRGNIDTRLSKLETGEMDAVILAAAGLTRLGFGDRITEHMDQTHMLPAVAQGALCVEIRENDPDIQPIVDTLEHRETRIAVTGERAFLRRLEGGCQVPMAAFARLDGDRISIDGLVADLDGSRVIKDSVAGTTDRAADLGIELAEKLLAAGAGEILNSIIENNE